MVLWVPEARAITTRFPYAGGGAISLGAVSSGVLPGRTFVLGGVTRGGGDAGRRAALLPQPVASENARAALKKNFRLIFQI